MLTKFYISKQAKVTMNQQIRTVKKFILVLSLGCFSVNAIASSGTGGEDANLSIAPTEKSGKVVVRAWNLEADAPATIKVMNRSGKAIYEEVLLTGQDHRKKYDFSRLKAGRYSLVLSSQSKEVTRPFVVGLNGGVREDDTQAFENFAPAVIERPEDHQLRVMFNNPGKAPLTVKLSDANGRTIYSEQVEGQAACGKLINMEKLPIGDYRLTVANYDYQYSKAVRR